MLIVGDNLKALISQHNMVEFATDGGFDNTCIGLTLDPALIEINVPQDIIVSYGDEMQPEWLNEIKINSSNGYILEPGATVLACSKEVIRMPNGYFGFLQTKGSLARLFVTIHCCDSQIDPGFTGKVTFEICNFSKMKVKIATGNKVGSLYIIKASTRAVKIYQGKYNNSTKPTIQLP